MKFRIVNLTKTPASPEQQKAGLFDLSPAYARFVKNDLEEPRNPTTTIGRAAAIVAAAMLGKNPKPQYALLADSCSDPGVLPLVERLLRSNGIKPIRTLAAAV